MKTHSTHFVYILSNPSMPGILKIGYTKRLAEDRSDELFNTSVPTPFEIEFIQASSNAHAVEKTAHKILVKFRVNDRREFFRISVDMAIEAVKSAAVLKGGIDCWASNEIHSLVNGDRVTLTLEKGQIFAVLSFPNMFSTTAEIIDLWEVHGDFDQMELSGVESTNNISSFSNNDEDGCTDPIPFLDRKSNYKNGSLNGKEVLLQGERLLWIPSREKCKEQKSVIFEAKDPVQVISRTWTSGMLLNFFTIKNFWPEAQIAAREAVKKGMPRNWFPRDNRGEEWEEIGTVEKDDYYWLPQLNQKTKK